MRVTSPITRAESLSLVKLEVLIQKCWQSLCCLWRSGVLSYVLLLLKASHMAEKKFASHRSVLSKVFCHVQFYSIRIISFSFLWQCFLKRQINRNGPCHPPTISLSMSTVCWNKLTFFIWGRGKGYTPGMGVGFVYGGQEEQTVGDKLSGLLFRPAYPCPSRTNNFNLIPFQSWKKVFFFFFLEMPNWHPHVFSPVKGDAVGVVLKNLTYHSPLLQVAQGTTQLLQTCCPSCMFTKKKKNFLKPGQKSWHFRERFFSKGGRRKMWRIMNSSSWKCTRQRSAQASIHGKWKESSHYCWDAQTQPR